MDTNEVIKQLDSIVLHINTLKAGLLADATQPSAVAVQKIAAGTCPYCGDPLKATDATERGIHARCYRKSRRRIESGDITDERLVEAGLILPPGRSGRRVSPDDPAIRLAAQDAKRQAELDAIGQPSPHPKRKQKRGE